MSIKIFSSDLQPFGKTNDCLTKIGYQIPVGEEEIIAQDVLSFFSECE